MHFINISFHHESPPKEKEEDKKKSFLSSLSFFRAKEVEEEEEEEGEEGEDEGRGKGVRSSVISVEDLPSYKNVSFVEAKYSANRTERETRFLLFLFLLILF